MAGRSGGEVAKLLFVAKEAIFKAVYPATNVFLDFGNVRVVFDASHASFQMVLVADHAPQLTGRRTIAGRLRRCDSHVMAVVTIDATRAA